MTTDSQVWRDVAYELIDDAGYAVSESTLATTRDTITDFQDTWGPGTEDPSISRRHRVWRDIQKNGKGTPRGTLIVIDFGDMRVANFC